MSLLGQPLATAASMYLMLPLLLTPASRLFRTLNSSSHTGILATIHMALLGATGLEQTAACSHTNLNLLLQRLQELNGVETYFGGVHFHEAVVRLPVPAAVVLRLMAAHNVLGG